MVDTQQGSLGSQGTTQSSTVSLGTVPSGIDKSHMTPEGFVIRCNLLRRGFQNIGVKDKKLIDNAVEFLSKYNPNDEVLSRFLLYSGNGAGKCAYAFKQDLLNALSIFNEQLLLALLFPNVEVFRELFDADSMLNDQEKKIIKKQLYDEYHLILNCIKRLHHHNEYDTLYQKLHEDFLNKPLQKYVEVSQKHPKRSIEKIYFFSPSDLIHIINKDGINPFNKEKFSPEVLQSLKDKFTIECKLYQHAISKGVITKGA
ncbi:MAG: hypothetical protein Solumvirus1_33 [Solumvirus sp.]|uniref:Uncharacterized protein n=1 Tax=Solumvirus sp. TaxID=2487773 RepID=A0A3G5AGA5_9VIRU|nr:MAG: hypothetical protein Solumvirus1_33 [Solumvirus sp.]